MLKLTARTFVAALCLATHAHAQEGPAQTAATTWEAPTGADYLVGGYGYGPASETTVIVTPFSAKVQMNRLRLEVNVPFLHVEGRGSFVGGGLILPGDNTMVRRSGLGDVTVGAAWLFHRGGSLPSLELAAVTKIPTAASGLGTEEFDYSAQLNLYRPLSPRVMLFASAGYQWLGDFGTVVLEDGLLAAGGINYSPLPGTSLGFGVSYRQEYWQGLGDQITISPYAQRNFGGRWRATVHGLVGLTEASPRFGIGLRLGLYG
jgi:hypothetical protein